MIKKWHSIIAILFNTVFWSGLFSIAIAAEPQVSPFVRNHVPTKYSRVDFTLAERYQVSHEYFAGWAYGRPVEGKRSIFERNGHLYQFSESSGAPFISNMDRFIIGRPIVSRLCANYDYSVNQCMEEAVNVMWEFDPLCSDRIGEAAFVIYLHKASSITIEQFIAEQKRLTDTAWAKVSRTEPPIQERRGANEWTLYKEWNKALYLSDASEQWYLPIGNGNYYYFINFTYKSASRATNDPQYLNAREAINRILDSFQIRELTPEEQQAALDYTTHMLEVTNAKLDPPKPLPTREEALADSNARLAKQQVQLTERQKKEQAELKRHCEENINHWLKRQLEKKWTEQNCKDF